MYSDLLDVLGNPSPSAAAAEGDAKHVAVSFKAGTMDLVQQPVSECVMVWLHDDDCVMPWNLPWYSICDGMQ